VTGESSVVSGGSENTALGDFCTVSGGNSNNADVGKFATVGGGNKNHATGDHSTVSGGSKNLANGLGSTVSGGEDNEAKAGSSTVSGGLKNIAKGKFSLVSGGNTNTASGLASVVIGGSNNQATGANSIAMGKNANAKKDRSLVINLGTKKVSSTNDGEFLVSSDSFTLRIDNEEATIDKKNIKNFKDLLKSLESPCDDKDNIVNVKNNAGKFLKLTCATIKERGICNNKVKKQKGKTAADFCCSCEADRRLEQINKQQAINEELHKQVNAQQEQIGILEGKTSTIDSDNIDALNDILNSGRRILSNDNEELELLREKVLKQDQEDLEQRNLIEHLREEIDMMKNTLETLLSDRR